MILLQTKFLVPRLPAERVTRPHLTQAVGEHLSQRIVTLVAPPGYGKTVLMADAVAALDRPVLWYQLDEGDSDPATFMAYLLDGIRQVLPEQGAQIHELLSNSGVIPSERALMIVLNYLVSSPSQDWVLVLDDYHLVTSAAVHGLTAALLENAPPTMGVMLSSRSQPPLPLSRWRAHGRLFEVRAEHLRFSTRETTQWLAQDNRSLPEGVVEQLVTRTEGWGAALQLAISLLHDDPLNEVTLPAWLEGRHQHIFNYLMDEVFSRQPPEIQAFLLASSVLINIDVDACQIGLSIDDAAALLEQVERSNLFLISLDQQRRYFRYHQLFREFLLERLAQDAPGRLRDLRMQAARTYEARGEPEPAIQYFILAGELHQAARILLDVAGDWLQQGRVDALNRTLSPLESILDQFPSLLLTHGKAMRQLGHFNEARLRLERANTLARQADDADTTSSALIELASLARSQGDYVGAQAQAQQAVDLLGETDHKARAFALMEIAKSQGFLEGMDLGSALAGRAVSEMELAGSLISRFEQAQLLRSLAQICWWHGDVRESIAHGEDALHRVPNRQSPLAAEILLTLATPYLYRHEYSRALDYAEQALTICEQLAVKELLPTALTTLGNILTRLGRLDEAESCLQRAIELATDLGVARYAQVMAAGYLAYTFFLRGRVQEAIQIAETALWSYEGLPMVYEIYVCRSVLADSYLSDGQMVRAEHIFDSLIDLGEKRQYRIPLGMAYFGLAYIHLKSGSTTQGQSLAERSLDLLQPSRAWELYVDQGERARVVCGTLAALHPDNSFVQQVLGTLESAETQSSTAHVSTGIQKLEIQTLGAFRVLRDGQEIPAKAWVSTKARDLLAYFVTRRGQPASLDQALEAIWSADGDRGATAFHTALYRLRGALKIGGDRPKFVLVEAGHYVLDESRFAIDVDRFDALIAEAESASGDAATLTYEQAIALYNGPYLDALLYPWVFAEQERLREAYCRALTALEACSISRQDAERALRYARRRLDADPLQEAAHRAVMQHLAELGDQAGVVRQYRQLKAILRDELGVAPTSQTEELVRQITRGAPS